VQVAFDVEAAVLEAVRRAAFRNNLSNSDQIRNILGLEVSHRPKRPRLTVTLTTEDYEILGTRYGLDMEERLGIKERVTQELIDFASRK
jgi:rRNA maturation endonuclease Nob1